MLTTNQDIQLMHLLTDYVPELEGDIIIDLSPQARELTREKLITIITEEMTNFPEDDPVTDWMTSNLELLKNISDEDFKQALEENIWLTEVQIGTSLFTPLTQNQQETLAQKIAERHQKQEEQSQEADENKAKRKSPFWKNWLRAKWFW